MTFTELNTGREADFIKGGAVFALGNFDGIHLGHRKVIARAVTEAKKRGVSSVVWCLSSPETAKRGELLTGKSEKISILKELGCDYAVFEEFENVRDMSPGEFVGEYLVSQGALCVVCGFNFRFGKGALADSETLGALCRENGIGSICEDAVTFGEENVSSSRIRSLLLEGNVSLAGELLAAPYSFSGVVKDGRHLGKSFGFPTVNLSFENGKLVPRHGVYFTLTTIAGKVYPSVSNVGSRPTVGGRALRLETHIIGFDGDIYGEHITVELKKFRRDESKFDTREELIAMIESDKKSAEEYFGV